MRFAVSMYVDSEESAEQLIRKLMALVEAESVIVVDEDGNMFDENGPIKND